MSKPIDTSKRTQARLAANKGHLDNYRLYSITEIEKIVGLTHRTLTAYILGGKLRATKIGGRWRVHEEDLKAFINGEDPDELR